MEKKFTWVFFFFALITNINRKINKGTVILFLSINV